MFFSPVFIFPVTDLPTGIPVPVAVSNPVITSSVQAGFTPTFSEATWTDVPALPTGLVREVETRFTVAGSPVSVPINISLVGGSLRVEQRARHVRGLSPGNWSPWSQSSPVTITVRTALIPPTTYTLTTPAPIASRLSLTTTVDAELIGNGTGNFTIAVTSPAPYIGGPFATDLSAEGGSALLNFEAIGTAPQNFIRPTIARTTVAPGGSQIKVGDTFTATPGLWVYDADDRATVARMGQWRLDGSPISGATGLTFTATAAGTLTYVETVTGAGTTRTSVSTGLTVAAVSRTANIPVTDFALTLFVPLASRGVWDVVSGDGFFRINDQPTKPATPIVTGGDASFTITG